MSRERAVNTVLDVGLAILFVSASLALIAGLPTTTEDEHDPLDADRTATVVGSATLNVTYSVEPVLETAASDHNAPGSGEYETEPLTRIAHGSIAELLADAAVANLTAEGNGGPRLSEEAELFRDELDHRVQSRLVGSQFETALVARWVPYDGASVQGVASVGAEPPPNSHVSTATLTVPSGMEPVQSAAIERVEQGGGYDAVGKIVADAVIQGYFPEAEAKHALERTGSERVLIAYRYQRMATVIDNVSPEDPAISDGLRQSQADPAAVNRYLRSKLAAQFASDLRREFDSPMAAASAVSTGEVTVLVRTWEP